VHRALCWLIWTAIISLPGTTLPLQAQGVDVTAKIILRPSDKAGEARHKAPANAANVVVWLSALQPVATRPAAAHQNTYRLVQKNKQFSPHLLVVPTGTSVEFPNEDPFFHNVFSLFNGKRFDLGLYESGTSRSVRFDREGVSYIFCNIHPAMGAIVLSLSTPYYGISTASGSVIIHNVPPGSYRLNAWSEDAQPANPADVKRTVQVSTDSLNLGEIILHRASSTIENHKNKFGEDYPATPSPQY
jgi:plastocyanin